MSAIAAIALPKENEIPLIQEISVASIKPSKANPRRRMDESALAELAESIRTHGVFQPVLIRPVAAGGFVIVCGERRWKASKMAGKETIPARIVNLTDAEALELAVIENLQREDVHELGYFCPTLQNGEISLAAGRGCASDCSRNGGALGCNPPDVKKMPRYVVSRIPDVALSLS